MLLPYVSISTAPIRLRTDKPRTVLPCEPTSPHADTPTTPITCHADMPVTRTRLGRASLPRFPWPDGAWLPGIRPSLALYCHCDLVDKTPRRYACETNRQDTVPLCLRSDKPRTDIPCDPDNCRADMLTTRTRLGRASLPRPLPPQPPEPVLVLYCCR